MKLTCWGAARQVTGSMHLLETGSGFRILIDCGLDYEKRNEFEDRNAKFPFDPASVNAVILTHAHIDHCGNLPNLFKQGFHGPVFCTSPTMALSGFLLQDSLNIQKAESRKKMQAANNRLRSNKKFTGKTKYYSPETLYSKKHIDEFIDAVHNVNFNSPVKITENIQIEFFEAGHILGAASVKFTIKEDDKTRVIGFTGDLGNYDSKLVPDPAPMPGLEYLISEGTYGGRKHESTGKAEEELIHHIMKTCVEKNGKLVIPAFSVGRTQAILFTLNQLYQQKALPEIKVFTDSPLAIKSTNIYQQNLSFLNEEARVFTERYHQTFSFPYLQVVEDERESEYISTLPEPAIIVSAAGMVEGGRIQMHVRNNIGNPNSTILIAGFCAEGTLGHRLLQGQDFVEIKHKKHPARAEVYKTDAFSAHPDNIGLLKYFRATHHTGLKKIFLVHGEEQQLENLASTIDFCATEIPTKGITIELE